MEKLMHARLDGRLVKTFGRAAPRPVLTQQEAAAAALRARVAEEIRQVHAQMEADRTSLVIRPPSLVEHQNRNPRLRRSVDDIAHYAVSVAAAEAGVLTS